MKNTNVLYKAATAGSSATTSSTKKPGFFSRLFRRKQKSAASSSSSPRNVFIESPVPPRTSPLAYLLHRGPRQQTSLSSRSDRTSSTIRDEHGFRVLSRRFEYPMQGTTAADPAVDEHSADDAEGDEGATAATAAVNFEREKEMGMQMRMGPGIGR